MIIEVLDCTLRDGGYVNDWNFGYDLISHIANKLSNSNIEIIECGYLSETKESTIDKSIFSSIEEAERALEGCSGHFAIMLNCGECDPGKISNYSGGLISTIRIAFHKHQFSEVQTYCEILAEKGYSLFLQPMITMSYSDLELLSLIEWANDLKPGALYIVDSFGTMRKKDVLKMYNLLNSNLSDDIKIGFHSHNNLQLSFSNAQELIGQEHNRTIIIDSSVYGMGRGAGNLCTELITQYLNENVSNKYNMLPIIEIMDEYIIPIYTQHPWGYSAPYYIAAINDCHPNYASYLTDFQTLCVSDINEIMSDIPIEYKHKYKSDIIHNLYLEHQHHYVDDSVSVRELSSICKDRNVLLVASGKSVLTYENRIKEYIDKNNPVIISVNNIPSNIKFDKIFISNRKRLNEFGNKIDNYKNQIIVTSNVRTVNASLVFNYSSYLNDDDIVCDNAGLMLINIMKKAGVLSVTLAGYDGYVYSGAQNYYDINMINSVQYEKQQKRNEAIRNYFIMISKEISIKFLTPSIYCKSN